MRLRLVNAGVAVLAALAESQARPGRPERAEAFYRWAVGLAARAPNGVTGAYSRARASAALANHLRRRGRYAEAEHRPGGSGGCRGGARADRRRVGAIAQCSRHRPQVHGPFRRGRARVSAGHDCSPGRSTRPTSRNSLTCITIWAGSSTLVAASARASGSPSCHIVAQQATGRHR
jgi:hypothetical protein